MMPDTFCKGCFSEKGNQEECPYCHFKEEATPEASIYLTPGTILENKYIIGNVLGQGGFGITYLGWDKNLDIKLAIKEFFPQGLVSRMPGQSKVISYSGAENNYFGFGLEKFLNEAKTLAQFEHQPNIVTVRDFFEANKTAYMIMSYIEGITFETYLVQQGGKIPFQKALGILMPVMDALNEVHSIGIMHRDISPDNIIIDEMGRIIIIDFGAARQEMSEKSKSLSVILKAGYAPEEQYRSKGKQGSWTDVYAVSATFYRAITGERPPESMDRLDEDTLIAPSLKGININKNQEEALLKGLSVKANNRYQVMKELQQALNKNDLTIPTKEKPYEIEESIINEGHSNKESPLKVVSTAVPVSMEKYSASMLQDLGCPVEITFLKVEAPKDIEKAFAEIRIRNLSEKAISALRLRIMCFDAFKEPLVVGERNVFEKRLQDLYFKPGDIIGENSKIELKDFPDARYIKVIVISILFSEDSRWNYTGEYLFEIELFLVKGEELDKLKEVSGQDSICYAREETCYWQCVCGRANLNDAKNCIRCGKEKKFLIDDCLNKKSIDLALQKRKNNLKTLIAKNKNKDSQEEQEVFIKPSKENNELNKEKRLASFAKFGFYSFLAIPVFVLLAIVLRFSLGIVIPVQAAISLSGVFFFLMLLNIIFSLLGLNSSIKLYKLYGTIGLIVNISTLFGFIIAMIYFVVVYVLLNITVFL